MTPWESFAKNSKVASILEVDWNHNQNSQVNQLVVKFSYPGNGL